MSEDKKDGGVYVIERTLYLEYKLIAYLCLQLIFDSSGDQ